MKTFGFSISQLYLIFNNKIKYNTYSNLISPPLLLTKLLIIIFILNLRLFKLIYKRRQGFPIFLTLQFLTSPLVTLQLDWFKNDVTLWKLSNFLTYYCNFIINTLFLKTELLKAQHNFLTLSVKQKYNIKVTQKWTVQYLLLTPYVELLFFYLYVFDGKTKAYLILKPPIRRMPEDIYCHRFSFPFLVCQSALFFINQYHLTCG